MYSDFEMNINSLLKSQLYDKQKKSKESKINAGTMAIKTSEIKRTVINIRDINPRGGKPVRPSIYSKPTGNHSVPNRTSVRRRAEEVRRAEIALKKVQAQSMSRSATYPYAKPKGFIAYLFRGNNIRVIAVSTSLILLLALCSFVLNIGNTPEQSTSVADHTYSFTGGMDKFPAANPAFAAISENVSFTITDGIEDTKNVSIIPVTVGEALEQAGIILNPDDIINYDLDDVVTDGINVIILRTDSKSHQISEQIPFQTQVIEVDTIKKGTTQVVRKGSTGLKVKYYEQSYTNNVLDGEVKLDEKVIKEPVNEIIYKGVGGTFTAPDGKTYNYSYVLDVQATAYGDVSGGKNPNWKGITYTGTQARVGVIAVDPNVISLGSSVYVTGDYGDYGICSAEDTGSAVKGAIIDIFMELKEDMVKFGRRAMKAYILE